LVAAPKALRKRRISEEKEAKVLCFFFSKKKALLPKQGARVGGDARVANLTCCGASTTQHHNF
jgi:hypothetical protein